MLGSLVTTGRNADDWTWRVAHHLLCDTAEQFREHPSSRSYGDHHEVGEELARPICDDSVNGAKTNLTSAFAIL